MSSLGEIKMNVFKYIYKVFEVHRDSSNYWRKKGAIIGDNCDIHSSARLGTEPYLIKLGSNVRINAGVNIITHDGGVWVLRNLFSKYKDIDLFKRVKIGNNVHIGTNAVIMPGVEIGDNCIIGVGAIVTKSIPANSIAVGVPAKVIEDLDLYIQKNEKRFLNTKSLGEREKRKYIEGYFNNQNG